MQTRLKINKDFKPCQADDGEEVYANGIFNFNISKKKTNQSDLTPKGWLSTVGPAGLEPATP